MAPYGRVIDSLLESSLEMGNALRATPKLHLLAEVVAPLSTDGTLAAGNANFEGNSVTNGEAIDLRPNAHYNTGRFMSKRQRCTGTEVAVGELLVVAHIGATDASGLNLDLKLPS
jgi:hypothetical protein